jgi:hypothetical protein
MRGICYHFSWPTIAVLLIGKEKVTTGIGSDEPPKLYCTKCLVLIIITAHVLHKDVKSRCDSPMISNQWPMLLPFLRPPLARVILGPFGSTTLPIIWSLEIRGCFTDTGRRILHLGMRNPLLARQ